MHQIVVSAMEKIKHNEENGWEGRVGECACMHYFMKYGQRRPHLEEDNLSCNLKEVREQPGG